MAMIQTIFHSLRPSQVNSLTNTTRRIQPHALASAKRLFAQWETGKNEDRPAWSDEWKRLNLGAALVDGTFPSNLFFVQLGFGVDQHGDRSNVTKAAIRAVRNAIEFNSIPGVIQHIPGRRKDMLIHVKLGIPNNTTVDFMEVAKVFPCKFCHVLSSWTFF